MIGGYPAAAIGMQAERDEGMNFAERQAVARMYYQLQMAVGYVLEGKAKPDCHRNVSFSHHSFLRLVRTARQTLAKLAMFEQPPKFLDVGCGLGTTLWLATMEGFEAWGLDRNRRYLEVAAQMIQNEDRVICSDLRDYEHYDEYDCLYWYSPLRDAPLQAKMDRRLAKKAKMPCVLILAFDQGIMAGCKDVHLVDAIGTSAVYVKCSDRDWKRCEF